MKIDRTEWFGTFGFVAALVLMLLLTVWAAGCDGNHIIGDLPGAGGQGGDSGNRHCALICDGDDVCGVQGVEECCPVVATCVDRYDEGFTDGVASVVCTTTDPECEDDIDSDCSDDTHKNAHKHCRGKGHSK